MLSEFDAEDSLQSQKSSSKGFIENIYRKYNCSATKLGLVSISAFFFLAEKKCQNASRHHVSIVFVSMMMLVQK